MKRSVIVLGFMCLCCFSMAQDPLFTQTWHSPVNTNPALSGTGKSDWRFAANSRMQWVRITSLMRHFSVSAERQLPNVGMGLGLLATHTKEGYLGTTGIYGILSKEFQSESFYVNFAMQTGMVWRKVDMNDYLFADQIDRNGPIPGRSSGVEQPAEGTAPFLDISPGLVLTWRNLMIGGAAHHAYNSDQGVFGDKNNLLTTRYTAHAGVIIDVDPENEEAMKIKPSIIWNKQGNSSYLKAGSLLYMPAWRAEVSVFYNNNSGFSQGNSFSIGLNFKLGTGKSYYNSEATSRSQAGISFDRELTNRLPRRTLGSFEAGGIYETNSANINSGTGCPKPYYDGRDLKKYPWAFL